MSLINNRMNRGDTLIEVLFAVAVFSLVAVGSLSIMNQGAATAQRALEITLVRQEIDAQAEALRFLNASYIQAYQSGITNYPNTPADEWHWIKEKALANESVSDFGSMSDSGKCADSPNNSFILNTRSAKFVAPTGIGKPVPAITFSQVLYDVSDNVTSAQGIWVEAISSPGTNDKNDPQYNAGYIDFHIRACWDSPGQSMPVTLGTIVRLYEPRG